MKHGTMILAAVSVVLLSAVIAAAQDAPINKEQFEKQLGEWLPGMGKEKIPERRDSQQKLQEVCFKVGAPGREKDRAVVCEVLAEALGTDMPGPTRIWLLKQLQYTGRDECVDAVAKSLGDKDDHVRDAARRALANIPVKRANDALLDRLSASQGKFRVGLINALGYRADPASVGPIAKLLGDKDQATAAAAANALGKIANADATKALGAALPKAPKALKGPFADAYLRCADKMLKEGKTKDAAAIYNQLSGDGYPKAVRLAALQGKLNAARGKNK